MSKVLFDCKSSKENIISVVYFLLILKIYSSACGSIIWKKVNSNSTVIQTVVEMET